MSQQSSAAGWGPAPRHPYLLRLPGGALLQLGSRTLVIGIVNVTPDSFSVGGLHAEPEWAVAHALRLVDQGADLLDIGGESTRPGAPPVSVSEEVDRVVPVIEALATCRVPLSIDTTKPQVAAAALNAGASLLNDVSLLRDGDELAMLAAERGAPLILMHSRGTPATMSGLTSYAGDVLGGVAREMHSAVDRAVQAGLGREQIVLDPGIGFAKTPEQSLAILAGLPALADLGHPLVVGVSRKSFIGASLDLPVTERLEGTLAAESTAVLAGAHAIRTHDVRASRRALDLVDAVRGDTHLEDMSRQKDAS